MKASNDQDGSDQATALSYKALRIWVGLLGFILPIILAVGTWLVGDCPHLKDSVSSYYYTITGNFLTGILCAVALFLITYRGYDRQDQIFSTIAGIFAVVTAVFPTNSGNTSAYCDIITRPPSAVANMVHYLSAAGFFVALGYMSVFLFTKSDKKKEDIEAPKRNRNRIYRTCGIVMLVAMAGIPLLRITVIKDAIWAYKPEFWFETIVLWAFGFSWLVKGGIILKD